MRNIEIPPILIDEFGGEELALKTAISLLIKIVQRKQIMDELRERQAGLTSRKSLLYPAKPSMG